MSKELCSNFLKTFIPPTGNKRKYTTNEMGSVVISIQDIFKYYTGDKLPPKVLMECLEDVGYNFMNVNYEYDSDTKKNYIRKNGNLTMRTFVPGFGRLDDNYIDVPAAELRLLRKTIRTMPPNTNPEKLEENEQLKRRLQEFFSRAS